MTIPREMSGFTQSPARHADGIVCFGGEDWWYHNRGHYDMQMMRELSRGCPVLYVNSLGMRRPRVNEGRMFLRRIVRKVRSFQKGFQRIRPTLGVVSPIVPPGGLGGVVFSYALGTQVRRAGRRLGVRAPLVWVACPAAAPALNRLEAVSIVYQRTDRYEEFPNVYRDRISSWDRGLKRRAELTIFCSRFLYEEEAKHCYHPVLIDHGVDFERFERAGLSGAEPPDTAGVPRPRIGFVGDIDAHTFDASLFLAVVRTLKSCSFVLVGNCTVPDGWAGGLPNVYLLGQKPYSEVPAYMAVCDVLIMPWRQNEWIRACNPVKLKEYLAVGRPVVSTPFPELGEYSGLIREAGDSETFAREIENALKDPGSPEAGRARVRGHTWMAKAERVLDELAACGVRLGAWALEPSGGERCRRWYPGEDTEESCHDAVL